MAQTGYTPISLYYSSTASATPSTGNLTNGELAINITDGKLFYKDNGGAIQVIGTKGGVGSSSTTQVLYNVSGLVVGSANLTFDGTTLTAAGLTGPHNGTVGATTPNTGVFTTAKAIAAATQDSVILQGRAGGTGSYGVTFTPTTLTASRTLTLPDASGTILQSGTAVTIAQGGTGQITASAAFNALSPITSTGDLIIGNGTNSATRLAIGTTGYVLTSNGTTASWAASTGGVTSFQTSLSGLTPNTSSTGAITLAGTLGATSGGTSQSTYTTGDILYASASNTLSKLAIGTSGQVLTISGGVPAWGAAAASGVTTISFGSTGLTPNTATSGAVTVAGPLAVANGGTGVTSSTGSGNNVLSAGPTFTGTAAFASITSSALTSGRVTVAGTSGLLNDFSTLQFDGTNLGIGAAPVSSKGQLQVGAIGYTDTGVLAGFSSSTAGYNQIILQNTSSNAAASTNFNVSNDAGTATTNFGEFGINSSAFTGTGSFSTAGFTYLASASTDLAIGTYGSNKIHFVVNSGATDAAVFDTSGNFGIGQATPGSKLDVKGTLRLSGSSSGYVGLAPAAAAGSTTYTLPAADGTSGQFLKTDGAATLSWATASGGSTSPLVESQTLITSSYSLAANKNAMSFGTTTIAPGVSVTIAPLDKWVITTYFGVF